uniref:Putative secreted protein n=1 Tax=Anopheles triannulatus TaxID=58253 RepID=A0A2M4B2A2_9DIPT
MSLSVSLFSVFVFLFFKVFSSNSNEDVLVFGWQVSGKGTGGWRDRAGWRIRVRSSRAVRSQCKQAHRAQLLLFLALSHFVLRGATAISFRSSCFQTDLQCLRWRVDVWCRI